MLNETWLSGSTILESNPKRELLMSKREAKVKLSQGIYVV